MGQGPMEHEDYERARAAPNLDRPLGGEYNEVSSLAREPSTNDLLREVLAGQQKINERLDRLEALDAVPQVAPLPPPSEPEPEPEIPVAPDELRAAWASEAARIFENWKPTPEKGLTLDAAGMAEAYATGGPLWLAAYAHDYLMDLPYNWRQQMVSDVDKYAQQAARELARDILRASTDSARAWSYERALDVADKRLHGIVEGRD